MAYKWYGPMPGSYNVPYREFTVKVLQRHNQTEEEHAQALKEFDEKDQEEEVESGT